MIAMWQLKHKYNVSSNCEARSMATKRQRVNTRSSDSSVADKKKDGKFQLLQSLSWLCCTTDEHDPSLPRIAVPFERRIFRGYITGFHETVFSKGGLAQTAQCRLR